MEPKWAPVYIRELVEFRGQIWEVLDRNKGFTFLASMDKRFEFDSVFSKDRAKIIPILNQEFAKALYY